VLAVLGRSVKFGCTLGISTLQLANASQEAPRADVVMSSNSMA
jgi:hypothetical protein